MPPSFEDIDSKVEKAQGDKARFLKSKEGLLPHFEFPSGETKEEKHYSKETLIADIMEERIEGAREMMENPVLLENAYRSLQNSATQGSEREGENIADASWAFDTLSALITTHSISHLSPKKQNEINSYLENPILLENAYRDLHNDATRGSKKEGENTINAFYTLHALFALISTHSLSRLSLEQQNKINSYLENPILLENAYRNLRHNATEGSRKEGEDIGSAFHAFYTLSALISTHFLSYLSPEKQNNINSYFENPILLENVCRDLQGDATQGSLKETEYTKNASWALCSLSSLITVKDYLREKGKKIDDENFAKEALNPTKNIPPRPEGIVGK